MRYAARIALSLLFLFFGTLFQHNFVINTTESFPVGIYKKLERGFKKGDLVLVCPPERPIFQEALKLGLLSPGLCPGGLGYLIKQIAAAEGDFVEISEAGVIINGECLKNSQRQSLRLAHKEKRVCRKLHNEVVLMSPHSLSFDSRYFGTVPVSSVITPLEPHILWN